jgi:hypothetical protein
MDVSYEKQKNAGQIVAPEGLENVSKREPIVGRRGSPLSGSLFSAENKTWASDNGVI